MCIRPYRLSVRTSPFQGEKRSSTLRRVTSERLNTLISRYKKIMSNKRVRLCIEENGKLYKTTSIYLLNDGSIKIDVPYCTFTEGAVAKLPISYGGKSYTPYTKIVQMFSTNNRPQLSIHASGFVQFSGPGIRSGINDLTGEYKGIALQTFPLTTPIQSGPTFGIQLWGLKDKFERLNLIDKKTDIIFKPKYFIIRKYSSDDNNFNTYIFECWIFSEKEVGELIYKDADGDEVITMRFTNYRFAPCTPLTLKVVRLKTIGGFIGIHTVKAHTGFADKSSFGYILGSPSEPSESERGLFNVLMSFYPPTLFKDEDLTSLDHSSD